jgi:catechol 2,3-dioxygenase-like lactoylglutathione lyase family enzyme
LIYSFRYEPKEEMVMKIGFVRIFVTDLQKALAFYTKTLGMELDYTDEKNWAQFKSGVEVSLAIEQCEPNHTIQGSKVVGRFVGVTLMVDSIDQVYKLLTTKGVEFSGRPEKQPWGGTLAHLKDLDDNVLTLMEGSALSAPILAKNVAYEK